MFATSHSIPCVLLDIASCFGHLRPGLDGSFDIRNLLIKQNPFTPGHKQ